MCGAIVCRGKILGMDDEALKSLIEGTVEKSAAETRRHLDTRVDALEERIEEFEERTTKRIDLLRDHVDDSNEKTLRHVDKRFEEMNHRFEVVAEDWSSKFDHVLEGIVNLDQKIDRRADALEEKMDTGLEETHALIKFSYDVLNARIRGEVK